MYEYAAGILIMSFFSGQLYVLLGRDYVGMYSDFGGKNEKYETNPLLTASRECYEETCGIFLDETKLIFKLKEYQNTGVINFVKGKTFFQKPYYMYMMLINYEEYKDTPRHFDVAYEFLKQSKGKYSKYLEKTELKWFKFKDLFKKDDSKLRNMFKQTIKNNKDNILKFASNSINTKL